jgi:hypothetical protein
MNRIRVGFTLMLGTFGGLLVTIVAVGVLNG